MAPLRTTLFFLAIASISLAGTAQDETADPKKTSYGVGNYLGTFLKPGAELLDIDEVIRGLKDGVSGADGELTDNEVAQIFGQFQQEASQMQAKQFEAEGAAWLAENAKKDGVTTLPSGLQYKVIKEGTGASPSSSDSVEAHYRGTFIDGTEFDSSYKRGQPATFGVQGVIPGWTEALQLMKEGSKWELFIPYDLAYGPNGRQGAIPPYATLLFEVELLKVNPTP